MQNIKVKTIDNRVFESSFDSNKTILDLKNILIDHFNSDSTYETIIIFAGNILSDETIIRDIGLNEKNWLICFFKKIYPKINESVDTSTSTIEYVSSFSINCIIF